MSNTELQARDIDTLKSNVARLGAYVNANELIQTTFGKQEHSRRVYG